MDFKQFVIRNVLRNGKVYFAYFLSTFISATLFFSLTMFILHPDKGTFKSYIKQSLFGAEIIAYLFLFFYVFYSSGVLLKKRNKEFGILYTIGISRKQLLKMIYIENMIISFTATISGIITGLVFSKLFLEIIEKLLRLHSLPFYFPIKAILISLICFLILGMFVSLITSLFVKEKELLHLLKATKSTNSAPEFSKLIALFSVILLLAGYGLSYFVNQIYAVFTSGNLIGNSWIYWIISKGGIFAGFVLEKLILIIIGIVVVATYLIFSQFIVFVIDLLKKKKFFYFRNVNLIWISNLFYRIRDNARMYFIITITSTASLILSGASLTFWSNTLSDIEKRYPLTFSYESYNKNEPFTAKEVRFIEDQLKNNNYSYVKLVVDNKYLIQENGPEIVVMKTSVYNQFAEQLNLKPLNLKKNEVIEVVNPKNPTENILKSVGGEKVHIKESIEQSLPKQDNSFYVIRDDLFNRIDNKYLVPSKYAQYFFNVKDWTGTYSIYDEFERNFGNNTNSLFLSKSHIYETEKRAYGTIMFLSIFLSIIFFVATGSFIYNKYYMDEESDRQKYKQLHKIGVTFKEMKKIVSIEIGIMFLLPYIVATIHSTVAFGALQRIFKLDVGTASITVLSIFLILQIGYFLIIRKSYLNGIKKHLTFS
ncbi:FtsX-like permease family protein [Bacillus sp. AFS041924]|uniref:FtsX-like permease family protein n=1 Tax=Bacillus sp. AFS041924 TaxID=2033503 RepID=UPI000BFB1F85|nr:ABC transporter permease [Bacillus sp. AFS041924]PGS46071.1 ABC transporter permease [Bacillus sp. AFS041924]